MNKYNLIEHIYVNIDRLTPTEFWDLIEDLSDRDLLDLNGLLWKHNTGLPSNTVDQIQSIHMFHTENKFISKKQRNWLAMTVINYWDRLSLDVRAELVN